ncbi:hypothetical protein GCM10007094_03510 [Pseudovibrio japonicus]|uniref:Gamma-glutamylcyclotransferase AIG2-like domain-containing protein n=1 Tax=Pseudovibrio japonicus TaxID=366534 RepID=A0ABQ3DYG5_9HYPH|nr:gamma-glutamylcyclotransferase family protein [Pseudovibrio japonicus]GHB18988.1 hypothetical protein GCM10007094_03510 [Pseudovibrio japonicus]
MTKIALSVLALAFGSATGAAAEECHPEIDASRPQMVVAYGSLMETESKQHTAPDTTDNLPVLVSGFQRAWNATAPFVGYSTTYLGVIETEGAQMNAAIYQALNTDEIAATDSREVLYCRRPVPTNSVTMLDGSNLDDTAQIWIYETKPEFLGTPTSELPITQSYVDTFLTGCLALDDAVTTDDLGDMTFSQTCITTTGSWSENWVNDRILPRRPYIHQDNAYHIDRLLHDQIPEQFEAIQIE